MPRYDFRAPRLFLDAPLEPGAALPLDRDAANYLRNVLRLKTGDRVLLFNGRDGEWESALDGSGKKLELRLGARARPQPPAPDLHYLFAPIKHARLDYMVQKAVELGVSRLQPITTAYTQVARVNLDRMRANAIEAAQQCGILSLPEIAAPAAFDRLDGCVSSERLLVFCDEEAEIADPVAALSKLRAERDVAAAGVRAPPIAVLIGPEGGFNEQERASLLRRPNTVRLALGPRILRADTAAVAALTLVQAVLGDWGAAR